jgi:hypothetical protein
VDQNWPASCWRDWFRPPGPGLPRPPRRKLEILRRRLRNARLPQPMKRLATVPEAAPSHDQALSHTAPVTSSGVGGGCESNKRRRLQALPVRPPLRSRCPPWAVPAAVATVGIRVGAARAGEAPAEVAESASGRPPSSTGFEKALPCRRRHKRDAHAGARTPLGVASDRPIAESRAIHGDS